MDKEKLEDVKTKLNEIADILYKGDVIEGLANMNCVFAAIEQEAGTLMADLISYELLPLLN